MRGWFVLSKKTSYSPTNCQNCSFLLTILLNLLLFSHILLLFLSPSFYSLLCSSDVNSKTQPAPNHPRNKWMATRPEERVKYWFQIESWIISILEALKKIFFSFMMDVCFSVSSFDFSCRWYMKVLEKTSCYKKRRKSQNIN